MEKYERNSAIELLKIFAIVLVVFSHAMPFVGDEEAPWVMNLALSTESVQRMIIVLFRYGGALGNNIFIISSAWFLIESQKVNLKKVFYMIGDCFAISVLFLAGFTACGYEIGINEMIKQFMPTYMGANWFISCYLLYYMIHPMLNLMIANLTKKGLFIYSMGMFFVYGCLQFLRPGSMYYSELIGFICIYFMLAYVKKYLAKTSERLIKKGGG